MAVTHCKNCWYHFVTGQGLASLPQTNQYTNKQRTGWVSGLVNTGGYCLPGQCITRNIQSNSLFSKGRGIAKKPGRASHQQMYHRKNIQKNL